MVENWTYLLVSFIQRFSCFTKSYFRNFNDNHLLEDGTDLFADDIDSLAKIVNTCIEVLFKASII